MSTPFLRPGPTVIAGTPIMSGDIQTGEIPYNTGGGRTAGVYSGAIAMGLAAAGPGAVGSGGSVLFWSGAGRLNRVTAQFPAGVALAGNGQEGVISGQPFVVYDSAITARSGVLTDGTIAESGRKILFTWYPPRTFSGVNFIGPAFSPVNVDVPFQSGLCVMALSGAPGFVLQFTPQPFSGQV